MSKDKALQKKKCLATYKMPFDMELAVAPDRRPAVCSRSQAVHYIHIAWPSVRSYRFIRFEEHCFTVLQLESEA